MAQSIMITGWGQVTQPKQAAPPYMEPLDMMERAARDAAAQAGVGVLASIDPLLVVRAQSRVLRAPGEESARRLGFRPRHIELSGIGGQVPQQFVNRAAGTLARGDAASFTALTGDNQVGCTVRLRNTGDVNIAELNN